MKKLLVFCAALALASLNAAASVSITSPASGSTVGSSIYVAASATANSGLPITGMYVYLDNVAVYHNSSSSVSANITASTGSHTVLVKAWDSHGTIYQQSAAVTVSSSASGYVSISSPSSGASSTSPVQVAATSGGGAYPITGMWVYVDNVGVYSTPSANVNTSLNMSTGTHTVLVKAWNSQGSIFQNSAAVTVGATTASTSGGVTLSSPAAGSTVGSPIQVAASATGGSYPITGMYVYLDNVAVYHTGAASLSTALSSGTGTHTVLVKAWNSQGTMFQQSATVNVGGTSTTTSASAPTSTATSNSVDQNNLIAASNNLAAHWVLPDGAILYSSSVINPYYANIAAIGLTKDANRYGTVLNWMKWYINHLNWPDKWNLYGTTYDYNVTNGVESSSGDADSTDSYAATFLSLAWAAWETGDPTLRSYVQSISYQLDVIGGVIAQTQQSDGLTWAKPDYQIKYLMDNTEVYRGLADVAAVFNAIGDPSKSSYYNSLASQNLQGINSMWMGSAWAVYKDGIGNLAAPNWNTWYADATAQLFPVIEGAVPASDSRSQQVYSTFNAYWPGWTNLSFNSQDAFPWALVQSAAALMGDTTRANAYESIVQSKYVNQGFPWPWYCMETGWFMRTNSYLQGRGF